MSRVRKFGVAAGTFGVALSIGFVMQNGDALAQRFGTEVPQIDPDFVGPPVAPPTGLEAAAAGAGPAIVLAGEAPPALPAPAAAPAEPPIRFADARFADPQVMSDAPDLPPVETAAQASAADGSFVIASLVSGLADRATDRVFDILPTPAAQRITPEAEICSTSFEATAAPAAMVDLVVAAPCAPETQVTLHHQGMIFTLVTDAEGRAEVRVPALAEAAVFIASFESGEGAVATTTVPTLANYDRAVLQWQGDAALQIHAREFGADYGSEGHVWKASARSDDAAVSGEGGFLVSLGDGAGPTPLFAEVYTYPSAMSLNAGEVLLTVEAEITEATCGREIAAQSLQIAPGAPPKALDLAMTLPDCDAIGDFVVLNTMLEDLTLAAR